jgi:hypothetical protein
VCSVSALAHDSKNCSPGIEAALGEVDETDPHPSSGTEGVEGRSHMAGESLGETVQEGTAEPDSTNSDHPHCSSLNMLP